MIPPAGRDRPLGGAAALLPPTLLLGALAVWNNGRKSAWTDEAFSFATSAGHPLGETINRAIHFELQPPIYFSLLNLWLRASSTIGFGRLLSTLCAMGGVVVLWITARRLGMRRPALVAWLAALTPGLVWAAAEMRGYALVFLVVATANLFFLTLLLSDAAKPRHTAAAYAVASIICLFTFYYTGFVLGGHWIAAMTARRRRMLVTAALLIAALALAPMVPMILPQFAVQSSPVSNPLRGAFPPGQRVYRAVTTLLETIMGEGRLFQVPHSRPVAMAILVAAPAAWLLARTSDRHRDQSFASAAPDHTTRKPTSTTMSPAIVLGIITIVPLVILAVLNATGVTLVFPRHGIVALPGLLLWLAYLIDGLPFRHTQIVIGGAVAALLLVSLVDFESHGIQVADWRGAARYVAAHSAPGEPVFVAPGYESLPFQYYYPWPGAVVPVPGPIHLNVDDDLGTVLRDSAQVLARLDPIAGNQPFWLVVSARPSVYSFGRPILEKVVAQYYRVTLDTTTLNIRLRHLVAR